MMRLKYCLYILLLLPTFAVAQNDSLQYEVTTLGIISNGNYAPFWMQSQQYGKISSAPNSANLLMGVSKEFNNTTDWFKVGFKTTLLLTSADSQTKSYLHEYYLKAKITYFDLALGAREELLGNQDSSLSAGGFLFSQNTRPIPKLSIGIEQFMPLPYTRGHIQFRGAWSEGLFTDNIYMQNKLLHHKYLHLKFGAKFPVNFQFGLDHAAVWGGNLPGQKNRTSPVDYKSVFFASGGGANTDISEQINTLGDHRISQSMKIEGKAKDFTISTYWQNFSEDGPVRFITNAINLPDGLWGVSIRNKKLPWINAILYEYLNTTDQSGSIFQKDGIIYGGTDNYFNNGIYLSGWNNHGRTIGTPFITSPIYNSNLAIQNANNRVQVQHLGMEGTIAGFQYRARCSFSKNYGTYSEPYNPMKQNISTLFELKKQFPQLHNIEGGMTVASDKGSLFGNSLGLLFSIRKTGNLF